MKTSILIISLFFSLTSFAQQGNDQRTVSECAQDLKTKLWWDSTKKKEAEKFCEDYSQVTIDCAVANMQAKQLTYTKFEKAVKDCSRTRK
ncbi:MAG: hypothetical protein JSU04_13350 [Bdellovibrionales bacterium]|nr:hypothetical protein [Bdellovibrionales bacterium]